jgi:hypothetical protein
MAKKKKKVTAGAGDTVSAYVDRLEVLNDLCTTSVARAIALFERISEELETPAWQQALRRECALWHGLVAALETHAAPKLAEGVQTEVLRAYGYLSEAAAATEAFLNDLQTGRLETPKYDDTRLDAAIAKIDVGLMMMEDIDQQAQRLRQKAEA